MISGHMTHWSTLVQKQKNFLKTSYNVFQDLLRKIMLNTMREHYSTLTHFSNPLY